MKEVIHWITEHKDESPPHKRDSHSHPDPTANEAIGRVLQEERRKMHPKKKHSRIGVWRAKEAKSDEGK